MEFLKSILQLPERSLVSRKITKAFFKRNFQLTLSERKLLDDTSIILQMDWLASLKPEQINVSAYNQQQMVVEEIQVISVQTNETGFDKNHQQIINFIQKFLPYHILLGVHNQTHLVLNTCTKRLNLNDSDKRTIEKALITEIIPFGNPSQTQLQFLKSMSYDKLDKENLKTLYDSYSQGIIALLAASILGAFTSRPLERSKQDIINIELIKNKEAEIDNLENNAKKETQLNIQVKINTEVYRLRNEIEIIKEQLK